MSIVAQELTLGPLIPRNDRISGKFQCVSQSRPQSQLPQIAVIAHTSRLAIEASFASDGLWASPRIHTSGHKQSAAAH